MKEWSMGRNRLSLRQTDFLYIDFYDLFFNKIFAFIKSLLYQYFLNVVLFEAISPFLYMALDHYIFYLLPIKSTYKDMRVCFWVMPNFIYI